MIVMIIDINIMILLDATLLCKEQEEWTLRIGTGKALKNR
jgi:hypothetical protein